jgi:2-hydroxychromene-2-carboxylate isomerase
MTMTARLEFFYDYVSAYSYMANSQLADMGDVEIVYRPMFLGGVMQATGNRPPGTVPARGEYLFSDLRRWAARYGIPFRPNSIFPQNTLGALRLAIAAQHSGVFHDIHQPLFDAMFVHDRNLSDEGVLASIVEDAGLDPGPLVGRISDPSIKDELKANTEEAVRRGAFGAPTFFVGDEMFFGNDRLDFVRAELAASG